MKSWNQSVAWLKPGCLYHVIIMTSGDVTLKLHISPTYVVRFCHKQRLPAELLQEDVHIETPLSVQQSNLQATRVRCPSVDGCKDKEKEMSVAGSKDNCPSFLQLSVSICLNDFINWRHKIDKCASNCTKLPSNLALCSVWSVFERTSKVLLPVM